MRPGDPSQLLGKVIDGRYEILQCIGEGGMGVVYKARQTSVDRMVAVKMLSGNLAKDRNWVQRFYNEAKACSRLHHPNTIRMFDFGQTREGHLFMAMEFLDGMSLRQVIGEQAPIDPQRMLKIAIQCCASLSEAHNLGIIHRDLKPDNVFLIDLPGSRDHVKLLDFGVAKLMMAEDFATQVGVVFGTPQYMSPEQGRGEPLTPRSDLYGVGILAYEMLTGSVPFTDAVPMNVLQMHLQTPVPPLPPRVPAAVQQIVMRALEKDPGRRYATASAMMEEAQAVLTSLQSGAFRIQHLSAAGTPDGFPPLGAGGGPLPGPPMGAGGRMSSPPGAPGMQVPPAARLDPGANPASMPTVLDRPSPFQSSGGGRPQVPASAAAAAAARTILVSTPAESPRRDPGQPHSPPPGIHSPYPPPRSGGPVDLRTVLLPASEGIVSMSHDGRSVPGRGGPMMPGSGMTNREATGGASALFWVLCLLTGLAVGIGAYWLVLELGK